MRNSGFTARLRPALRAAAGLVLAVFLATAVTYSAVGAPGNDNWADATLLVGASGSDSGTNVDATTEANEPVALQALLPDGTTSQTVWWKWEPPSEVDVTFAVESGVEDVFPTLAIYTGPSVEFLVEIESDADADQGTGMKSRVFLSPDAGQTYYIQVGAYPDTPSGPISLTWEPRAVPNDDFADARPLDGDAGVLEGYNVGATTEDAEPGTIDNDVDDTVWHAWTPSADGIGRVSVASDFNRPTLGIYTGTELTSLQEIDFELNADSLDFDVVGGNTYYVQVGGNDTSPGSFALEWELILRPGNDDLGDALDLVGTSVEEEGTNVAATLEDYEPADVTFDIDGDQIVHSGGHSVWYRWQPAFTGYVDVQVEALFQDDDNAHAPLVQLFEGPELDPSFGTLQPVDGLRDPDYDDPVDLYTARVEAGRTYYVQVLGDLDVDGSDPTFDFMLTIAYDHDLFEDALELDGASGAFAGTLVGATLEPGEPEPADGIDDTVWFHWTAPQTGTATFEIAANDFNAAAAIYTGDAIETLEPHEIDLGGASLALELPVEDGTTYYLQLATNGSEPRTFALEWNLVGSAPPNDAFADAEVFDSDSGAIGGTTNGATLEPGEPDPAGGDMQDTVWYTWTPSEGGAASISLDPAFSATLAVYTGSVLESLERVAHDFDTGSPSVSFDTVAGTTYSVQVGTYFDSPGSFSIAWGLASPQNYLVTTTADDVDDANCVVSSCTLRQAVNAANAGGGADTVVLPAGTYQLSGSSGALVIDNGMSIDGAGARTTTIVAPSEDRVLDVTANAVPVSVTGVTLSGGTADGGNGFFGGNVRSAGDLTLTEVTVTGGSASSGGGLSNDAGTMVVDRSTITGNQALTGGGDAGAIQNFGNDVNPGSLTVRNSTISGNTARIGAAVWSWGGATSTANTTVFEHSTITANTATAAPYGAVGGDGTFSFGGSIVSGNTALGDPSNCTGTVVSLGSNLESATDCGFTEDGDLQNTDPLLLELGDNGGPTDTHALVSSSPAVDAVAGTCGAATDQRGTERPQGAACDIGAFELVAPTPPPNDDWADAEELAPDADSVEGTTDGATLEAGEPDPEDLLANSVWYSWTPDLAAGAELSLDASFGSVLGVYTGGALTDLTLVAGTTDSSLSFDTAADTTYWIQVGTAQGEAPGAFTLAYAAIVGPPNDHLADAAAITGPDGSIDGMTVDATTDAHEPVVVTVDGSNRTGTHSVWYRWTAPGTGTVQFAVEPEGTPFDHQPLVIVYAGPASDPTYDSLEEVGTNEYRHEAGVYAVEGTTFYVQVLADVISELDPDFDFTLTWASQPGAPTLTAATPADGSVALEWTPAPANGSPLTGYVIYRGTVPGQETELTTVGDVTTYTDTTAVNGMTYSYKVAARNAVGLGPLSNALSATPAARPGAPTLTGATPGNGAVALTWTAPESNGGAAITNYRIYRGTTTGGETLLTTVENQLAFTDSTAANGTTYFYKVGAVSAAGEGALSNELSATPATVPGAPTLDTATAGNGSVALAWSAPASSGGAAITGYRIYRGTSADQETLLTTVGNVLAFTDDSAVNGTTYFYRVSAVNIPGEGGLSNELSATPAAVPGAPSLISATGGNGNVELAWSAPGSSGGSPVTGYRVYRGTTAGDGTLLATVGNVLAYTDTTTANGTTYFYKVVAVNRAGDGPLSNELSATPATVPGAPTLDSATAGNASVALGWTAPASNGGAAVTGYRVYRGTSAGQETLLATLGNVTGYLDTTAANGTTYFFKVSAINAAGEGAQSNGRSATPAAPNTRDIAGTVRAADGAGVAGVPVRACLSGACVDATSGAGGAYAFANVVPGAWVVQALPIDPAMLAAQTTADVTSQSLARVDLRLSTNATGASDAGPTAFRVTGCVGGTLHYVATADGRALGSNDVADGAGGTPVDGVYAIDVSALGAGHPALLQLDVTITCGNATETQTAVLFADPSGTVVDDSAGAPLEGATITLLDAAGNPIPQNDPRLSPATSANPQTSDTRGAWGWDVAPGTYLVRATKANCGTTTSGPLVVTPTNPVTGVVLHLACVTPTQDPTPPPPGFPPATEPAPTAPPTLPDPVDGVNFNVIPISGTVLVNGIVLPTGQQIPFGAEIDATQGIVSITTIGPDGRPQTAFFYGGVFQLALDPDGVTALVLKGGDFSVCGVKTKVNGKRKTQAAHAKSANKKVVRALWGTGKGRFRTKGRYSSATVRGTLWYHADRCDGTFTQVNEGSVAVLDAARKRTLIVRAGHSVLVRPK